MKLLENVFSRTIINKLVTKLVDNIFDDIDVDRACGSRHNGSASRSVYLGFLPQAKTQKKSSVGRKLEREFKGEDPWNPYKVLGLVELCEVKGRRRARKGEKRKREREERERRERERRGKEERGGQERENKEWNINRFASDYNA